MPHSSRLDLLREAVQREISEDELRADRCDSFMEQIILYQNGQGSLPDEQQFLLWREDLKWTMAVRALRAAMDVPERDDPPYDAASAMPSGRSQSNGGMDSSAS